MAAQAAPKPDLSDVFAAFQPPPGSWKCACLVWNKEDALRCVCCESLKPGVTAAEADAANSVVPTASSGTSDAGNGGLFGGVTFGAAPAGNGGGGFNFDAAAASSGGFQLSFGAPAASSGGGFQLDTSAAAGGFQLNTGNSSGGFQLNTGAAGGGFNLDVEAGAGAGASSGGFTFGGLETMTAEEVTTYFASAASTEAPKALSRPIESHPGSHVVRGGALTGQVYIMGSNDCEQLGLGDENQVATAYVPTLVPLLSKVRIATIAVGGLHTAALTSAGQLWTWGCNDDGVLGRDGVECVPTIVDFFKDKFVNAISAGDSHMAAITASGDAYAWGTYKGAEGYIGFSAGVKRQTVPALLEGVTRYGSAVKIACGADHTAVVTSRGTAVAWGNGEQGQLGRRVTTVSLRGKRSSNILLTPYRMVVGKGSGRRGGKVVDVACGGYHTFAIAENGDLYACGLNNYGQLGVGDAENRFKATKVEGLAGVALNSVTAGMHHSVALSKDGRVYTWGRGDSGNLGLVNKRAPVGACSHVPLQLPPSSFGGAAVRLVQAGGSHAVAVTDSDDIYTWGYGDMFNLGNQKERDEPVPFKVEPSPPNPKLIAGDSEAADLEYMPKGQRPIMVGAGGQHTVILAASADKYDAWVKSPPAPERKSTRKSKAAREEANPRARKRSRR